MIQNPFANMTPVVKNLLMLNILFYVTAFALGHAGIFDMDRWFAAHYPAAPDFRLWQIITYMFMHAPPGEGVGLLHILFNMIALVSFGSIIEQTLGSKRFFLYYMICGIGALACQMGVQAYEIHSITGHFFVSGVTSENVNTYGPYIAYGQAGALKVGTAYVTGLVGASGAVFGVLVAFGMLYPNLELMVIPIPVPLKAKFIVPLYILVELFFGVRGVAGDQTAHFAHIGGALVGFIVIKLWGIHRSNNFY